MSPADPSLCSGQGLKVGATRPARDVLCRPEGRRYRGEKAKAAGITQQHRRNPMLCKADSSAKFGRALRKFGFEPDRVMAASKELWGR
jgi:hypothetical protein